MAAGPDAAGGLAIALPFEVAMAAPSGYGLDYALTVPSLDPDTILGLDGATPVFFQVDDPTACTVAAADTATPYDPGQPVAGLAGAASGPRTAVDHWCVVIAVEPPMYQNIASAAGTDALGQAIASTVGPDSSWTAYLMPDPAVEPTVFITLTPSLDTNCTA